MSFSYEDIPSASSKVRRVWHTRANQDGIYTAALDGCWDLIFTADQDTGAVAVMVNGQGTQAAEVPYRAGVEALGVSFEPGTILTGFRGDRLLNSVQPLPLAANRSFWLHGQRIEIPRFDNTESFIAMLEGRNLLEQNPVVDGMIKGKPLALSDRSVRRHFVRTTGLSPYYFHQIQRAQKAVMLIQQGMSFAYVSAEAGYTDQAHMTRALKLLVGKTPAQIGQGSQ